MARGLYRRAASVYRKDALNELLPETHKESAIFAAVRAERKANALRQARAPLEKYSNDIDPRAFNGRYCGFNLVKNHTSRGGND